MLDERVLEEHRLGEMGLIEKLERVAAKVGYEIPPGEWKSLSVELVHALTGGEVS
jgi:hypothetical protein